MRPAVLDTCNRTHLASVPQSTSLQIAAGGAAPGTNAAVVQASRNPEEFFVTSPIALISTGCFNSLRGVLF